MKEKSDNLIKTPSKIQSFEEVQKALQDLAKQLNDLGIATNSSAEGEITDKDGKTGDIRITQNEDKTYGLELKTEEGWKFPTVGESPVQLTGKKGEKARPDAVVDKFKDELGSPSNMPKPDFDTGWFDVDRTDSEKREFTYTHELSTTSIKIAQCFVKDSYGTSGGAAATNAVFPYLIWSMDYDSRGWVGFYYEILETELKLWAWTDHPLFHTYDGTYSHRNWDRMDVRILLWK
jgi:hypothetical protein